MAVFLVLLMPIGLLHKIDNSAWLTNCEYWLYPLQTIVCGLLLIRFWRQYAMAAPRRVGIGLAVGVVVFVLWITPQAFLGFAARTEGFNPMAVFGQQSPLYWISVVMRFVRLAVVVPLVEEIFWRGFLLRYFIREDFDAVPIGAFSWLSFTIVALAFAFSHSMADWPAAIATGVLYNAVAYWTKSLSTCVLAHAATNLLLGIWIMRTQQWGFW
jgi:CAAX prenyl protease-like protein